MDKKWLKNGHFFGENDHFCKISVPKDIYGRFENDQFMLEVAIHDQSLKNNNIKITKRMIREKYTNNCETQFVP